MVFLGVLASPLIVLLFEYPPDFFNLGCVDFFLGKLKLHSPRQTPTRTSVRAGESAYSHARYLALE